MLGPWTRYVLLLEGIFHEDVEKTYTGLSEESKSLYEEYKKQYVSDPFDNGTIETGNALMNNMKEVKKRWQEAIRSTNMTQNSRKAWKIIKNISNDPTSPITPCLVSANPSCSPIAHQQQRHDV